MHAIVGLNDPYPPGSGQRTWDVPDLVRRFKTYALKLYGNGVMENRWPAYRQHLWQRSYWDRIIRNDNELEAHRQYIFNNALVDYFRHLEQKA